MIRVLCLSKQVAALHKGIGGQMLVAHLMEEHHQGYCFDLLLLLN